MKKYVVETTVEIDLEFCRYFDLKLSSKDVLNWIADNYEDISIFESVEFDTLDEALRYYDSKKPCEDLRFVNSQNAIFTTEEIDLYEIIYDEHGETEDHEIIKMKAGTLNWDAEDDD